MGNAPGWLAGVAAALTLVTGSAAAAGSRDDARLDALFAQAGQSRALLALIVRQLPKGGDLHNHSGGGVYAEDILRWAAEKDGCVLLDRLALSAGPCAAPASVPVRGLETRDVDLYNDVIDSLSTRRHAQGVGDPAVSGHERFFTSFGRFSFGLRGETGRILAVNLEQAAGDNNNYLELMADLNLGPDVRQRFLAEPWDEADRAGRLQRLKGFIDEVVARARVQMDEAERVAAQTHRCGSPQAAPACRVAIRYLMTVGRESPPEQVFGRIALAFALVTADRRFVGVNIAQPEDGPVSLRDYSLHMRMFAFLRSLYPQVPLTLHAGELTQGLTPPRDLRFHIREAVEIAGARRIGHGVDIAYEDDAPALLARMARERIAVEINLTSNDVILGVRGAEHPLRLYLAAGVPVVLSTDDSGVSRGSLTQEYLRAVTEHGLRYTDLRRISRDSLTYAFIEGESLWEANGRTPVAACRGLPRKRTAACSEVLARSARAREQWRLEEAFARFESELPGLVARLGP